ncbi:rco-1 [Symbiodinium microadriaticum]|nr:rco-1 [Symbiodinium microadriaticum]
MHWSDAMKFLPVYESTLHVEAGFRRDLPTAWICEGLFEYHEEAFADRLLAEIGGLSGVGDQMLLLAVLDLYWLQYLKEQHAQKPVRLAWKPGRLPGLQKVSARIAAHGWQLQEVTSEMRLAEPILRDGAQVKSLFHVLRASDSKIGGVVADAVLRLFLSAKPGGDGACAHNHTHVDYVDPSEEVTLCFNMPEPLDAMWQDRMVALAANVAMHAITVLGREECHVYRCIDLDFVPTTVFITESNAGGLGHKKLSGMWFLRCLPCVGPASAGGVKWPRPRSGGSSSAGDSRKSRRRRLFGRVRMEMLSRQKPTMRRSWACDEELIVAGLYSGALEAFHWESGERWQFNGRHNDEVVAVALNREFVLSGSGDPGYYGRPPRDASVRLWSRQGLALRKFDGHADSVRAVGLFKDGLLARYGLSGSLDQHLLLWTLSGTGGMECTAALPGACRCLRILAEDGRDARVLATANLSVVELAVSAQETSARVTVLKQVVCQDDLAPAQG